MREVLIVTDSALHAASTLKYFVQIYAPRFVHVDIVVNENPAKVGPAYLTYLLEEHIEWKENEVFYRNPPVVNYNVAVLLDQKAPEQAFFAHKTYQLNCIQDPADLLIEHLKRAAIKIVGEHYMFD